MLDVGSGSGILSIAAAKLGAGDVLAVDVDPIAVEASAANARRNRLSRVIRAREGSAPSGEGPFDVVLANLIASLLVTLADGLVGGPAPGRHAARVRDLRSPARRTSWRRSRRAGLELVNRWAEGDWVALEMRRPA